MGITIHYNGKTNRETAYEVISFAKQFAEALKWEYGDVNRDGYVCNYIIVYNNVEHVFRQFMPLEMIPVDDKKFLERFRCNPSTLFGIYINPPMNTESVEIMFYEDDNKYVINHFCKTQIFNEDEMSNAIAHIVIISLLMTIKYTWIPDMEIVDEGEFYPYNLNKDKLHGGFNYKTLLDNNGYLMDIINKIVDVLTKNKDKKR